MFKWGTTQMKVKVGSYTGPFPSLSVEEIGLIPLGTETPASSLQTGGRQRKTAGMTIKLKTYSDYNAFYLDHMASTVRNLELIGGFDMPSAMISSLEPPVMVANWLECNIRFLEV